MPYSIDTRIRWQRFFVLTVSLLLGSVWASPAICDTPDRIALKRLVALRNRFIHRIVAEGYKPTLPAPKIVLGRTDAFGNYEEGSNEVHMATWSSLSNDDRQMFEDISRARGGRPAAEQIFENGTYRWVFVHELGHWWQRSQHQVRPNTWAEENGANRIAMAYWNEQDPRFMADTAAGFRHLRGLIPDPVPAGESKAAYLDAHFQDIGPTPAYTWFQSDMIVALAAESPAPTFHRALSQPLYPD